MKLYLRRCGRVFSLENRWGFGHKVDRPEDGLALAKPLITRCGSCVICAGPLFFNPEVYNTLISKTGTPVPADRCPNLNEKTTVDTV